MLSSSLQPCSGSPVQLADRPLACPGALHHQAGVHAGTLPKLPLLPWALQAPHLSSSSLPGRTRLHGAPAQRGRCRGRLACSSLAGAGGPAGRGRGSVSPLTSSSADSSPADSPDASDAGPAASALVHADAEEAEEEVEQLTGRRDGRRGGPSGAGILGRLASLLLAAASVIARRLQGTLTGLSKLRLARLGAMLAVFVAGFTMMLSASLGFGVRVQVHAPQEVLYSDFLHQVRAGRVRAARFDDAVSRVYFDMRQPAPAGEAAPEASTSGSSADSGEAARSVPRSRTYYTRKLAADPNLVPTLLAAGVQFGMVKTSMMGAIGRMVGTAVGLWLPLLPLFFIMRRVVNNRTGATKKKKAAGGAAAKRITFADVEGVDAAKEELREVVACLKDSQRYARLSAKTPSGVLLCGAPGTGKTLLAKAVAGEAGVPFFAASASEFVELFVGRGAARIRDLFAEARKRAPSVVFIDELDAVGGKRGLGLNEERDQTLNQLLTELDGFEGREGVLLLAATNRPEVLDPALTRPGRLSRKVVVPLPDEAGRRAILGVHLRNTPFASAQDKEQAAMLVAKVTRGFSGAELANVANEAALLAGRRGVDVVTVTELVEAVHRTRYGVSGGAGARQLLPRVATWRKRLADWLLGRSSQQQRVRVQPLGPS